MKTSNILLVLAVLVIPGSVAAGIFISAYCVFFMWLFLPLLLVSMHFDDIETHRKYSIDSRHKSEKITTGRFKGKMLMSEYDVRDIEREVLNESVEEMLERVCKEVPKPTASSLAESTIRRLDEQLDPRCGCSFYDDHRKSGHDRYIRDQKAINESNARRDHLRQKEKAKLVDEYPYYSNKDYKYIEDYFHYTYMLQKASRRY